jgi:cephalosporin hydroxylase
LLAELEAFEKATLAGEYYQSFDVNSRSCPEQFTGSMVEIDWVGSYSLPAK